MYPILTDEKGKFLATCTFGDGFAPGFNGASAPISTRAADVVQKSMPQAIPIHPC